MSFREIAQRAFNAPLLVDPAKAQAFLAGFGARILGGQIILPSVDVPDHRAARASRVDPRMSIIGDDVGRRRRESGRALYPVRDGIAIIEATGTLVHRGAWLGNSSGETSYEGLSAQIAAAAADSSVRGIALEIDTFGGQAAGAFDLADLIRAARDEKPVWAFVAESALSAGYAMASQANRIVLPRTGEVGSIGVLSMHVDYSERLADDGIAVTLIHAGAHKVDGNPFEPLADPVREQMHAECARLRDLFAATVAAGRGSRMSVEAALATEARIYSGEQAVAAGLADEVSDLRGAFSAFVRSVRNHATTTTITGAAASGVKKETTMSSKATKASASTESDATESDATKTEDENDEQSSKVADDPDQKDSTSTASVASATPPEPADSGATTSPSTRATVDRAEAEGSISRAAAAALADVASMASRLGVNVDLAAALRDGTSPDALRASVLEAAAKAADDAHVSTAHKPAPAPGGSDAKGESPLVAAAKKSAETQRAARNARQ